MANPTIASQGLNREVHCATAKFTWSATAAGTYSSSVVIPAGAQVISASLRGGSVVPGTGTSIQVSVGGVAISSAIAFAKYDAVGEQETEVVATHTDATSDNGVIAAITLGVHNVGITYITVCYVV
jgi:hypothetical protein